MSDQEFWQEQQVQNRSKPQSKPMDSNRTVETIKIVPQSPGELRNLAKQAKLIRQLQKLQTRSSGFLFEDELADGARAAGQTVRIVGESANPFTGPVRAYAYLSILATSVGLGMLTLHLLGVVGGKVANNVKVQVRYGEQTTQTAPSRLTTGRGTPPVVDWVPGDR